MRDQETVQSRVSETGRKVIRMGARSRVGYADRGYCLMEINETGWRMIRDTRKCKVGYLHVGALPPTITPRLRDMLLRYMYQHDRAAGQPSMGGTPQTAYFKGLSPKEREAIGNNGVRAYYA